MQIARTSRLILRQLSLEDAAFILVLLNSQGFVENIGDKGVRTLKDAKAYLQQGPLQSYVEHGFGLYAVVLAENGFSIGICGLLKRSTLDAVDLGYAFLPQYWGNGYAFEAAKAALEQGHALGIERIVALVSSDNLASKALLNKLGLTFEKVVQLEPSAPVVELFS
ncbi:MAG: GNAT family N-acetyltransferase [Shewanella sp.]|uniref:GNAT family N-acetyltransferase n=1 Tax=Shewanella sp. TaxID=50422 RepID=UPI003F3BA821